MNELWSSIEFQYWKKRSRIKWLKTVLRVFSTGTNYLGTENAFYWYIAHYCSFLLGSLIIVGKSPSYWARSQDRIREPESARPPVIKDYFPRHDFPLEPCVLLIALTMSSTITEVQHHAYFLDSSSDIISSRLVVFSWSKNFTFFYLGYFISAVKCWSSTTN